MPAVGMHNAGPCNITQDCLGCIDQAPRYLCVDVEIVPGPYSTVCCNHISFRILGGRPTHLVTREDGTSAYIPDAGTVCGWHGAGQCSNPDGSLVSLGIDARIVQIGGQCYTRVSCPLLLPTPLYFTGIFRGQSPHNTGTPCIENNVTQNIQIRCATLSGDMVFTGTNPEDGSFYTVTISQPDLIRNPLIDYKCSPCLCAGCLPASFCVGLTMLSPVGGLTCGNCVNFATYVCSGKAWLTTGTLICGSDTFSLSLTLPLEGDTRGCAIIGSLTGGQIHQRDIHGAIVPGYDFLIPLESQLLGTQYPGPPDMVRCIEASGDGSGTDRKAANSPGGNPLTYQPNIIQFSQPALINGSGATIGSLTVTENFCNADCGGDNTGCRGGCEEVIRVFTPNTKTCPPVTLTATCIAPGKVIDGMTFTMTEANCSGAGFPPPITITPTTCSTFCGTLTKSCPPGTGSTLTIYFELNYKNQGCGTATGDHPNSYYLDYYGASISCVGSGIGPGTYSGEIHPADATCSPFQLDFTMPPFCKGITVSGVVVLVPFCDADNESNWTLRITL